MKQTKKCLVDWREKEEVRGDFVRPSSIRKEKGMGGLEVKLTKRLKRKKIYIYIFINIKNLYFEN